MPAIPVHAIEEGGITRPPGIGVRCGRRGKITRWVRNREHVLDIRVGQPSLKAFFSLAVVERHPRPVFPDQRVAFNPIQLLGVSAAEPRKRPFRACARLRRGAQDAHEQGQETLADPRPQGEAMHLLVRQ